LVRIIERFGANPPRWLCHRYETVHIFTRLLSGEMGLRAGKGLVIVMIEMIDLYLIRTVFYITALGLYELFIDDQVPTPAWLHITHLNELKAKLLGVVVIIAGLFLGKLVDWDGTFSILAVGGAIALVIVAISAFLRYGQAYKE
jgi:uncharacterized membrane protein YqhA